MSATASYSHMKFTEAQPGSMLVAAINGIIVTCGWDYHAHCDGFEPRRSLIPKANEVDSVVKLDSWFEIVGCRSIDSNGNFIVAPSIDEDQIDVGTGAYDQVVVRPFAWPDGVKDVNPDSPATQDMIRQFVDRFTAMNAAIIA